MADSKNTSKTLVSSLLLILAAFIWGTTFVAQSKGLELIGNFTFQASRSYLAVAALLPVSWYIYKTNKRKIGDGEHGENKTFFSKRLILGGVLCGVTVCLASISQQYGIILSGVGKSGFLTTLYILIVPIFGLLFKRRVKPVLWVSIIIATCGMYFLCVTDVGGISVGDLLLILCAFLFAVQIMIIDRFVAEVDAVRLSLVQFAVSAVISTVFMLVLEKPSLSAILGAWVPVFYSGVLSSGVAFTLQIVAQRNLNPTVTSLLMSLESVFAVLAGVAFGERLSSNEIFGCVLVFVSIILAQIPLEKYVKKLKK